MMQASSTAAFPEMDLEIVGPEAVDDPAGYFGRLRAMHPVVWDSRSRSWVVTGYPLIARALRDSRTFSSDRIRPFIDRKLNGPHVDPKVRQAFEVLADWLVFNDEPKHLRLRKLVNQAFMSKAMERLAGRFESLFAEVIAAAPDDGAIDLLQEVAVPFSASVISEMFGVPPEDRHRFTEWHRMFGPIIGASLDDGSRYDLLAQGVEELLAYIRTLMVRYRGEPGDNLLSELIRARDAGEALSEEEILSTCTLVLFAGSETTANLICNAILALLEAPGEMARLRSGAVPIGPAVEEFLRFNGSGKAITRVVREDTDVLGVPMRAGQRVFLIVAAGNRDPAVFDRPDELILDRTSERQHLGFGYGLHSCMGLQLARLEATIAIPGILAKWSSICLNSDVEWHPQLLARGPTALCLRVGS